MAFAQPIGNDTGAQPDHAERYAIPVERTNPIDLSPIQGELERLATALEAIHAANEAEDEKARAQRDLAAQEDMAKWAKAMFIAAIIQAILSGGGILLIWQTLDLNREAIGAAVRAAVATEKAVEIAADTAERQLRAYVAFVRCEHATEDGSDGAVIEIANTGQTPAYAVSGWIKTDGGRRLHLDIWDARDFEEKLTTTIPKSDLGAGGSYQAFIRIPAHGHMVPDAQKGMFIPVMIWGEVCYHDIFKKTERHTRFKVFSYRDGFTRRPYLTSQDGNDSD